MNSKEVAFHYGIVGFGIGLIAGSIGDLPVWHAFLAICIIGVVVTILAYQWQRL